MRGNLTLLSSPRASRSAMRSILILLSLPLLLLLACSSPEERFADHVERAEGYIEENRIDDALIELQSALKIDPDDPDVNWEIAHLLKARGSIQAAAFHFGETYRLDPTRVQAAVEQATLLSQTAPRRARQILVQAKRRYPDDPAIHRAEATLAASQHQPEVALAAARRAVELAPDDPESYAILGAVHLQHTRELRKAGEEAPDEVFQAGIDAFEKLDALTDGHVGARVEKARLLGNMGGHDDEAAASFRSAIELARERDDPPAVVFAARRFAGWARRAGRPELQLEAQRAIVEAEPERVADWDDLALLTLRVQGREAADAIYAELLEKQPELPAAHVVYARHLVRSRREAEAIAHLDRAISEGVDSPLLWEQLVQLELSERRVADARATIEDMRSRIGDHEATRLSEVRLALFEDRGADALEILRDFTGAKESAETELLRARAEKLQGNSAAAASAVERAIALSRGSDAYALRLKSEIHAEAGEWEAVQTTLERLARRAGLGADDRVLMARARYALGEPEQGREILEKVLAGRRPPITAAVEFARHEGAAHPAEARKHLEEGLRFVPGYHPALEAITRLDLKEGRAAEALARLDQLVERQLAGPRVLLLRSQILTRLGQLDRAEADALRAFEAIPELIEAVDMLFVIYQAKGELAEARRSFEEAESVGVLHKGARVLLGRLYAAEGETEKARAMYEKVLAEDPHMVSAKIDLARLLADGDEIDRALELAEQAQRALPEDPAIADTVGYLYQRKGRHEIALQQFRYALDLAEQLDIAPPAVHYHMGVSLAELGRKREAVAAFDRALEIDPSFQDAKDARMQLEAAKAPTEAQSSS